MAHPSNQPRIAWLVNLFGDPDSQHAHAATLLRPLSAKLNAVIVPLYCLDADADALRDVPGTEQVAYTRARLNALLSAYDLPPAEPIITGSGEDPSTKDKSTALARAVDDADVLFTFLHSQTHSAVDRFMFGSFAEEFFTRTRRPVMILNPHAAVPEHFASITFGTDLGEQSAQALERLLPLARMLGAEVHIEHQIVVREMSFFMKGPAAEEQYEQELRDRREYVEAEMRPMVAAAEALGVHATASVAFEKPATTPAAGLEKRAENGHVALLSLAAHGDKKRPGNIGSTALWLIRHAKRPVLVIPASDAV